MCFYSGAGTRLSAAVIDFLALSLLMLRILADDHDFAMSLDHFALVADRLY